MPDTDVSGPYVRLRLEDLPEALGKCQPRRPWSCQYIAEFYQHDNLQAMFGLVPGAKFILHTCKFITSYAFDGIGESAGMLSPS